MSNADTGPCVVQLSMVIAIGLQIALGLGLKLLTISVLLLVKKHAYITVFHRYKDFFH